jgi:hypothetical protein
VKWVINLLVTVEGEGTRKAEADLIPKYSSVVPDLQKPQAKAETAVPMDFVQVHKRRQYHETGEKHTYHFRTGSTVF